MSENICNTAISSGRCVAAYTIRVVYITVDQCMALMYDSHTIGLHLFSALKGG